jgi:transcriptional regulator with XRE-family HTH domain
MADASSLLSRARKAAGLSQRELARRAGTSQSVIARIERGQASPGLETLRRLLAAAGFELRIELEPTSEAVSHMLEDVDRILALTPEQRLLELRNVSRFLAGARRKSVREP